jgi:hypothetical protein
MGSIYNLYHQLAFYLVMFAIGLLIIMLFSGARPKRVANIVLISWPLILIAPLIDKFAFNRAEVYYYARPEAYLSNLETFFTQSRLAPGIAVQLAIMLLLACFYVFSKTVLLNRSSPLRRVIPLGIVKSILTIICFYFVIGIIGAMPVLMYHLLLETGLFSVISLKLILFISLFIFGIFLFMVIINLYRPKILKNFVKNLDGFSILYFVVLAGFGVVANGFEIFNDNTQEAMIHVSDSPYAFTAIMTMTFGSVYAFLVHKYKENKVLEQTIQGHSKKIKPNSMIKQTTILMAYTCFGLGLLLGPVSSLLCLTFIILMWFYPPLLKSKREKIWGSFILSVTSCLTFFIGYFTTSIASTEHMGNYTIVIPVTGASPTVNVGFAGIAILCLSLSLFLLKFWKYTK